MEKDDIDNWITLNYFRDHKINFVGGPMLQLNSISFLSLCAVTKI